MSNYGKTDHNNEIGFNYFVFTLKLLLLLT